MALVPAPASRSRAMRTLLEPGSTTTGYAAWLATVVIVATALVTAAAVAVAGNRPVAGRLGAVLAAGILVALLLAGRGALARLAPAAGMVAVALIGLAAGDPVVVVPLALLLALRAGLVSPRGSRGPVLGAGYAVALAVVLAVQAATTAMRPADVAARLVAVFVVPCLAAAGSALAVRLAASEQAAVVADRLRHHMAALIGAADGQTVLDRLAEGLEAITAGGNGGTSAVVAHDTGRVLTARGARADELRGVHGTLTPPPAAVRIRAGGSVYADDPVAAASLAADTRLPLTPRSLLLLPLAGETLHGIVVLAGDGPLPARVREAATALTGAAGNALDDLTCGDQPAGSVFAAVVGDSADVLSVVGVDGIIRYASPAVAEIFGVPPARLTGTDIARAIDPADEPAMRHMLAMAAAAPAGEGTPPVAAEVRFRHSDRSWRHVDVRARRLTPHCGPPCSRHADPDACDELVLNVRDVTDRVRLREDLTYRAFHDDLTGLANRALFLERASHALEATRRSGEQVAMVFLDLDDFKAVNDSHGHLRGDEVLAQVSLRIAESVRPGDTAARLGGDEFAVLLPSTKCEEEALLVADRMLSCLDAPVPVGEGGIVVRASAGVALGTYPQAAGDLLRQADTAMYLAKSQGKSRTQVFQAAEHRNSLLRLQRVAEMERGLERNEFVVHYQPVVDLEAGTVKGFEALVRWQHPERGLLPPAEFIALAEESGFIVALGDWVLRESCRQLSDWRSRFDVNGLGLSVNLSMEQVRRTELEVQVRGALDDNGLDAGRLTLEITESVLLDDHSQVNGRLGALKDLGVNLALDDFGTGYSSLAYLQQFPIDTLKIDRAFVAGIEDGHESTALVSAIMNLGRSLSLQTVAEGIERPGQLSALQRLECTVGQGFYFARPMAPADVDQLLADGGRLTPA